MLFKFLSIGLYLAFLVLITLENGISAKNIQELSDMSSTKLLHYFVIAFQNFTNIAKRKPHFFRFPFRNIERDYDSLLKFIEFLCRSK